MINIKDFLKCFISFLLLLFLYNCLRTKENLTFEENKNCKNDYFGNVLNISTFYNNYYLCQDDKKLVSRVNPETDWVFEKIITDKPNNTGVEGCKVNIKTRINGIDYYLSQNDIKDVFGNLHDHLSLKKFGSVSSDKQEFLFINIKEIPDEKYAPIMLKEIKKIKNKNYFFIITSPKYFLDKDHKQYSYTKFLKFNKKDSALTLVESPTMNTIWNINVKKEVKKEHTYLPTKGVGVYPTNKKNKEFTQFMPSYVNPWNNTFYSVGKNDIIRGVKVELKKPEYTSDKSKFSLKKMYTEGTITFDENYDGELKNKIFDVKTFGANKLYGKDKDNKFSIMVEMVQLEEGKTRPRIRGWVKNETNSNNSVINIKPICGIMNDFNSECISHPTKVDKYLLKKNQ